MPRKSPPPAPEDGGWSLDQFRPYLKVLARMQLSRKIQGKLDESDIVQQTLLQAHRALPAFRGGSEKELAGWLRQILAHNMAHALRDLHRDKRDIDRERSLEAKLNASSARLADWLANDHTGPVERAARNERLLALAAAVEALPDGQREAVELRYLHELPVSEIAERLERTVAAVAGLLHRGLAALKKSLSELEA